MHWPQVIIIMLLAFIAGVSIADPDCMARQFWRRMIAVCVFSSLLYAGGFFS